MRYLFAIALPLVLLGSASRADVTRIWLLRAGTQDRGTHLWIEKAQASSTNGTLHGIIAGQALPVTPSVPTDKLVVDSQGFVSGGTITLPAKTFTDIGKSSLDLKIAAGAVLTVDASVGVTLKKAGVTIGLPFGKNGNTQPSLTLDNDLVFRKNGDIGINVTSGALAGGTNKIGLAGFSLSSIGGIHVAWDHKPGDANDTFLCELTSVKVAVPLPGILAQDSTRQNGGIELSASKLTVDGDGNVSAAGDLTMDSTPGIQIPLAKPMDFVLTVHHFECSLTESKVTPKKLTAELTLPASFTTDVEDNPDRVTITDISITNTGDLYANQSKAFTCRWNGFQLSAPMGFIIDLSETQGDGGSGTDKTWEGLKLPMVWLSLPDQLKDNDGKPLKLAVTGGLIDEHGFTGVVNATNVGSAKIQDFQATLNRLQLTVKRGEVMDSLLEGTLSGIPGWKGDLGLKGQLGASGAFGLEVTTSTPIPLAGLHAKVQVDQGKLEKADGKVSLLASGSVTLDDDVDTVGGAVFRFTNLGIDKNGDFIGDRDQALFMDLPEPLVKEFGPVTLSVSKVGFGKQKRQNETERRWFMAFDGGASLGGDLPVSIGGDFEGLYVWQNLADPNGLPDIDIKGLHVDLGIDGVLTLTGDLRTSEAALPVSKDQVTVKDKDGKKLKYITGDIQVGLPILKTATPINAGLKLLVAPRSWYILGGGTTPSPIVLGQSGLALSGFFAGIGHNVARYPAGAVGIPSVNYDLIPDPDNTTGRSVPFTITAGTRVQTMVPTPLTPALWGDLALTVDVSPLDISLNGNLFLADPPLGTVGIPADPMKQSRVLTGSIGVHTQPELDFYAHLGVDLNFPTRDKWVIKETGAVDLTLNKNGFSALAGGPITADRTNHTVDIQNPFEIKLNLPGLGELAPLQGALTFIATPTKGGQPVPISLANPPDGMKANLQAAAKWKQPFDKKGDVSVGTTIHYEASGTIDLETYLGLEGAFSADITASKSLGSFLLPNLPAPNAYFYGDAWAKASVENAKIAASAGPFDASVTANLTGWLEGQILFYYGGASTAGGGASLEGDISGNVSAKLFKTWTFPVSTHQKIEVKL